MSYYIFIMVLKIYALDCINIPLDVLLSSPYISELEKISFDKYKNESTKKEKIASSHLKNKYIGKYYLNEHGKPMSDDIYFNVSHSRGRVVLVIDEVPVGIDIEVIREVDDSLKNYISNNEEKNYLKDNETFFNLWTNKEALVKADGTGINKTVNKIPGLPINGTREYEGKVYFNKTIKYKDAVITVSHQKNEDFTLEVIEEVI